MVCSGCLGRNSLLPSFLPSFLPSNGPICKFLSSRSQQSRAQTERQLSCGIRKWNGSPQSRPSDGTTDRDHRLSHLALSTSHHRRRRRRRRTTCSFPSPPTLNPRNPSSFLPSFRPSFSPTFTPVMHSRHSPPELTSRGQRRKGRGTGSRASEAPLSPSSRLARAYL